MISPAKHEERIFSGKVLISTVDSCKNWAVGKWILIRTVFGKGILRVESEAIPPFGSRTFNMAEAVGFPTSVPSGPQIFLDFPAPVGTVVGLRLVPFENGRMDELFHFAKDLHSLPKNGLSANLQVAVAQKQHNKSDGNWKITGEGSQEQRTKRKRPKLDDAEKEVKKLKTELSEKEAMVTELQKDFLRVTEENTQKQLRIDSLTAENRRLKHLLAQTNATKDKERNVLHGDHKSKERSVKYEPDDDGDIIFYARV